MEKQRLGAVFLMALAMAVPATAGTIPPEKAVIGAAKHVEEGVSGLFAMRVAATGRRGNRFFLDSQEDYRDQRNLTIVLPWPVAVALADRTRADPTVYFKGKAILVRDTAKRVRVDINRDDGKPTGLYYYQTHVLVTEPDQIEIAGFGHERDLRRDRDRD